VNARFVLSKILPVILLCFILACKQSDRPHTAFYYWKSSFNLNPTQVKILKQAASNTIYVRFFDIAWSSASRKAHPNAIINFKTPLYNLKVTPVIYISNKVFENIHQKDIDSLAINTNKLLEQQIGRQHMRYQDVQIDCDWTLTTRERYFQYLKSLKAINHHGMQVTIRLHQIKYKETTGIPPADKGVLMFYNMGKLTASQTQRSSIYNEVDANKYVTFLTAYPLKLDVALPLFSWAIHIRNGRVTQVYEKLKQAQLNNPVNFERLGNLYTAKRSFFLLGIYVKQNDIFKLEVSDINTLSKAAKQLAKNLPPQNNRTIIYYELANLDTTAFNAENITEVSDCF
jgi:hypothetical protein